jgi:hypothetical protein
MYGKCDKCDGYDRYDRHDRYDRYDKFAKDKVCSGRVIESTTLPVCENKPIDGGCELVTVVLSEFTVKINVESKIKLCDPAVEIKRIKKSVFITQCRVLACTNILFLQGYVRKNIEYATANCRGKSGMCGDIRHTTVYVPFECTTEVDYKHHPEFNLKDGYQEISYVDDKCLGEDMYDMDICSKQNLNEKVYCKLVGSKIYEADIVEDCDYKRSSCCYPSERVFTSFTEKEVIYIKLKLLQDQQR